MLKTDFHLPPGRNQNQRSGKFSRGGKMKVESLFSFPGGVKPKLMIGKVIPRRKNES